MPEPLAGRLTVAVRYVALGGAAEGERLLASMRAAAVPLVDAVAVMPYAGIAAVHADPPDPMPVYENQALLNALPEEAVDALLAVAGPGVESLQTIVELRQLGGAFAREPRHPSALCHRDAAYALTTIGLPVPDLAEQVSAHAAAVVGSLAPWSTGGQLPNFAPSDDPGRPARVYTPEALQRLQALAERHDPAGVFRTGQVVRSRP